MPFKLLNTDCSPLVIDYNYEISNEVLLVEYVGEMVLGHHLHLSKIINSLSVNFPLHPNDSIDKVISKISNAADEKRDGWLFQMISWVVLCHRNTGAKFFSNYPHFAPAQHGIDGLAVVLNEDNTLKSIIITEDKCTTSPRGKITQQVYPEFNDFEKGEKNNALISIISPLLASMDNGNVLEAVQNNIFDNKFRVYRISITREERHNPIDGREMLFKNYDDYVLGATPQRSGAATIHIPDLRNWMNDFAIKVIAYLESKKVYDVQ